ncbi:metal-dependent hydrolase [Rhodomicrobium sp. Az07]|uniref:metal-dependent hydrolase n=1 Tax=Rhodomicrobium sp. Az07 TaxID=2839034 RepID=UPI001BEA24D1|nr:metal-dependent hydrolase [Rhodomicrobium sp. Az07]MBT3071624.1 metal-dependent hydrolase [Rhodomicrobium sp. Az07]
MANFNTHLAVAAVGSGLCATVALAGNAAPNNYLLTLTLAGTIGGILPDIDLEKAIPSRILFSALGVIAAFIALFSLEKHYSIAELWIVWLGVYALVRYGVHWIFHSRTRHRGIFHSLLAGGFFMVLTAVIFGRIFGEPAALAWLTGLFVLIGFVIHLALDEIYSVDIEGAQLKKSFGTALKLIDMRSWRASAMMLAAFVGVVFAAPSAKEFEEIVAPPTVFTFLKERMLPKGNWFGIELPKSVAATPVKTTGTP